jgi:hypothetical protein
MDLDQGAMGAVWLYERVVPLASEDERGQGFKGAAT